MLFAIHKTTGRIVSAEKVKVDSSWVGTERDSWICPESYIYTSKIEMVDFGDLKNQADYEEFWQNIPKDRLAGGFGSTNKK
jgi:hypothetical protein